MPEAGLGVVVLLNSEVVDPATGTPVPMAARIADSLLYGFWLRR